MEVNLQRAMVSAGLKKKKKKKKKKTVYNLYESKLTKIDDIKYFK
jgi:hypothetical protein